MAINVANKIMGTCIVRMMEQYKKRKGFTLEGVLFTKEEIIASANEFFPMRTRVKDSDMRLSALRDKCLFTGSDDSLSEYYRLCIPEDANYSDLSETVENEEVAAVLHSNLPEGLGNIEQFLNLYFQFIRQRAVSAQERYFTDPRDPRKAIWIAAATLAYNEYVRTQSQELSNYGFQIKTIDYLARTFMVNPVDSGYSSSITQCTKGSYRPINPFLVEVNDRRRIALPGEVENTRPDNLPMDFMVNTIKGAIPVRTLVEFTDHEYAAFVKNTTELVEDAAEPQEDDNAAKEQFLRDVYMDESDYEKLIALIRRKKNIILQGAPGVGKTYCAKKLAYAFMGEEAENRVLYVQFHQGYSYEDFVEGYRPNDTGYALKKGVFYEFCKDAGADLEHKYFFIIDEMNRGNLSKIFGELFTLLEAGKRGEEIKLVYSGEGFSIPENVYLIGLMNTADRSLAMIDYALRRRFGFFTMKPGFDTAGFKRYKAGYGCIQFDKLIEQIKKLNQEIAKDDSLGEGFCIGHSFFCDLHRGDIMDELGSIVDNEIVPLLEEYWFDESEKVKEWSDKLRGTL